jgi:hypothetical protein
MKIKKVIIMTPIERKVLENGHIQITVEVLNFQ